MDLNLKRKNVLISGASKGIGLACAKGFAAEGCNLHLASRTEEDLLTAKAQINAISDVDVTIYPLDLSQSSNVDKLAKKCSEIDILVNNAGAIPAGNIEAIDERRWREAWDLKVFGYINMTRQFYPLIKNNGGGVIMNVIGLAGVRVDRNYIAGSTGNASIIGFTNAMGAHALDEGMRVLGVCPGAVQTERITTMLKTRAKDEKGDEDRWQDYFSGMPLNRPALVEEVADVVVFLCSDRASWLTGTTINLDGGVANRGGY
ncbi:short-chain dehydrogenase/reductase [Rhodospirillaceae bacterium]|nr:short-chain dehydrogenase/reductase [Rhodospirillaceae bacterium]|tara:strand:- start:1163 stop:1942 length:780 start_codon:yes stop_codon:yes gene_type:complete